MTLDVYCSISKQHKHVKGDTDSYLLAWLRSLGFDNDEVDLRSFNGGYYSGASSVVGNPDILTVYMSSIHDYVGKGCYTEIQYAKEKDIPVLIITDDSVNRGIYLVQGFNSVNDNDWTEYCRLDYRKLRRPQKVLDNFGVELPSEVRPYKEPTKGKIKGLKPSMSTEEHMLLI